MHFLGCKGLLELPKPGASQRVWNTKAAEGTRLLEPR